MKQRQFSTIMKFLGKNSSPEISAEQKRREKRMARFYAGKLKKSGVTALCLGGGGTRGFAHIGAIKAFEENGIDFDIIVGTSAGSIIGCLYAYGISAQRMLEYGAKKNKKVGRMRPPKNEEDEALLEDVGIENRQALDMCNIYRDILSGMMDAYASIISNNQNVIMKLLTVATIIISIPTLVASFWGMNTHVPFQDTTWGFYVVLGVSIIAAWVAGYFLLRNKKKK